MTSDTPLYARMLRLRRLRLSGLHCFLLCEVMVGLGALLALAELVPWWGVFALPSAVALMVKVNDAIMASTASRRRVPSDPPTRAAQVRASQMPAALARAVQSRPVEVPPVQARPVEVPPALARPPLRRSTSRRSTSGRVAGRSPVAGQGGPQPTGGFTLGA